MPPGTPAWRPLIANDTQCHIWCQVLYGCHVCYAPDVVSKRRAGRPPTGGRGEKVSSYAGFTVRLPPEVKQTLQATAHVTGEPMWRVIAKSVALYARSLSPTERRLVRALTRLRTPGTTASPPAD